MMRQSWCLPEPPSPSHRFRIAPVSGVRGQTQMKLLRFHAKTVVQAGPPCFWRSAPALSSYLSLLQTRQKLNEMHIKRNRSGEITTLNKIPHQITSGVKLHHLDPRKSVENKTLCTIACAKTCQLIKLTDTQLFVHSVVKATFCTGNNTAWKWEAIGTCVFRLNLDVRRPRLRLSNPPPPHP